MNPTEITVKRPGYKMTFIVPAPSLPALSVKASNARFTDALETYRLAACAVADAFTEATREARDHARNAVLACFASEMLLAERVTPTPVFRRSDEITAALDEFRLTAVEAYAFGFKNPYGHLPFCAVQRRVSNLFRQTSAAARSAL